MANTYTQLYVHLVFAVKNRLGLIAPSWKDRLYQYISALLTKRNHKLFAINGMQDHVHIFVSMSPTQSVSEMAGEIKRASSLWINENRLVLGHFEWQDGYGAFTYAKSQIDAVMNYINNQETHHHVKTFREEYMEFLRLYNVDFDERYIFSEVE